LVENEPRQPRAFPLQIEFDYVNQTSQCIFGRAEQPVGLDLSWALEHAIQPEGRIMKPGINRPNSPSPISRASTRAFFCLKTFFPLLAALTTFATATFARVSASAPTGDFPIIVSATGGADNSYLTLGAAFAAINAGTHTGTIAVSVVGNTIETVTASLNASGTGSASYTSVTITPSGAGRTVTGSIVGAIIKLNGADNVTIDGRFNGTGRNLTVSNSNASTPTAAIWVSSNGAGAGATNNVIRNLELACGADQQASANSTFGIIMCGNAISVASNGDDNDNNSFIANRIVRVRYGIVTRGVTTNLNLSPVVTDNIIGPAAFGPDQIGKTGILMQADTGATVSRNTVQFVGVLDTNTASGSDRCGIGIGSDAWSTNDTTTLTSNTYLVTKNVIHDIVEEKTFSAIGIKLATTAGGSPTSNLVANNFIYNIRADGTLGDQVCGIGFSGGNTDRVVFNSISMTGDMDPGASVSAAQNGIAIGIHGANGTNNANLTLADNSIYLDVNSNTPAVHYHAISANSAAYSFGTGFEDYNNLYINPANAQLRTGAFSGAGTTEFATLADWKLAYTANQDAHSIQANPLYVSNTADLHLGSFSPNINIGLTIAGIADDVDSQGRPNGANPDIGADELYVPPLSGLYNVGAGQTYTSLTNAGGIFAALNSSGASGNITINITSDLTAETGANALNQLAGGFTVLIKPGTAFSRPGAGTARTISGTSAGGSGLIKLNGADKVTIDGSDGGGSDRSLTITNGNLNATVIWIASAGAGNGATDNTVKNCIISGNPGVTAIGGIVAGSGTNLGAPSEAANSNNTIQNNAIFRVQNSCFLVGVSGTLDQNWQIIENAFGSTVPADKNTFRGILLGNANGFSITRNIVNGVVSTAVSQSTMAGIQLAFAVGIGAIAQNQISDIKQTNSVGWGSNGIDLAQSSTTADVLVINNFISDVASAGFNGVLAVDNGYGIMIESGGFYSIWHNSINLGTNQGVNAASGITAAVNIAHVVPANEVDLENNILSDPQTLGTRYGVIDSSSEGANVFLSIDNNVYFAQNVGFLGGPRVTLTNWQTATTQDNNSLAANPLFVSATDLHITCASPAADEGIGNLASDDIDGQPRSPTITDIGADEITAPVATSAVSRKVHGGAGTFNINLPFAGPVGIESRSGGGTNAYRIVFTFSVPVTATSAAVTSGTGIVGAMSGNGTNTITVDLTGVTNAQYITVTLNCVDDGLNDGKVSATMGVLVGDRTASGNVTSSDISAVKLQSGSAISASNFRSDVNVNGSINGTDVSAVKLQSGTALPP
jgi:dockerin type I repeat protein